MERTSADVPAGLAPADCAPADSAFAGLADLAHGNPAATRLLLAAIRGARQAVDRAELAACLADVRTPATCTLSPQGAIAALIRHGGLVQTITVDGESYPGDEAALRADDTIADDAVIAFAVQATDAGLRLVRELAPASRIGALLDEKPAYRDALVDLLAFCDTDAGRTRDEIAAFLAQDGDALRVDPATGFPRVYPAFFTGCLETVGALVWDETWRLTEEGEDFLHNCL